ncbi:MAG: hypothetical protein HYZ22_03525 [Chloroflexi bacterium]|nr:hypothetical protein [Chloroflexota bacterium]
MLGKTVKIKSARIAGSLYDSWRRHFDSKTGFMIAGVMGGSIWFINSDHGFLPAATAALKQMAYTFLVSGFTVKMCENLAVKINHKTAALVLSVLIPSAITIFATYAVHSLKGTPEPLNSTMPTMIGPLFFYCIGDGEKMRKSEKGEEKLLMR